MTAYTLVVVTALGLYVLLAIRQLGVLSASSLLVLMQFNMVYGTLSQLDLTREDDTVHANLVTVAFVVIVLITTVLSFGVRKRGAPFSGEVLHAPPPAGVRALIVVSIAVCVAYYGAIGYIALFESIESVISGTDVDIAGLRLESYAGSTYYFPGIVNQFKNVFLPTLTVVVVGYAFHARLNRRFLLAIVLPTISVIFLLGTGQRGAFVTFVIVVAVYVYLLSPERAPKRLLGIAAVALPLFMVSTFALGRQRDELQSASGVLEQLGALLQAVLSRLTLENQGAGVTAFRYVYTQPTQWGAQWADLAVSLIPGVRATTNLDGYIFSTVYGSTRGTMPPSLWGSAYYNWGFAGALVLALILAVSAFAVTNAVRARTAATQMELIGYAGFAVVLTTWMSGTPATLVNEGLLAFAILWIWGRRLTARHLDQRVEPLETTQQQDHATHVHLRARPIDPPRR